MNDIADILNQVKKDNKLKNKDLAEIFSVSDATVSRYMKGDFEPSLSQLMKLAEKYPFSLDSLIQNNTNTAERLSNSIQTGSAKVVSMHNAENQAEMIELYKKLLSKTEQELKECKESLKKYKND